MTEPSLNTKCAERNKWFYLWASYFVDISFRLTVNEHTCSIPYQKHLLYVTHTLVCLNSLQLIIAQWRAAWLVLVSEFWWVVNWKTVGQKRQEKWTGEIKNKHNFSWIPERKRQFGRSRPRRNVKDNVMNWT